LPVLCLLAAVSRVAPGRAGRPEPAAHRRSAVRGGRLIIATRSQQVNRLYEQDLPLTEAGWESYIGFGPRLEKPSIQSPFCDSIQETSNCSNYEANLKHELVHFALCR